MFFIKITTNEAKELFAYKVDGFGYIYIYGYKSDGEEIKLPSEIGERKVTHIENVIDGSKYDFGNLKKIVIPDSVTIIGDGAFYNCTELTNISIPGSVTSIGGAAFIDCESLASITIPDSVTNIGDYAFWNCKSLRNVSLPYSCIVGKEAIPEGTNVEFI